MKLGRWAILVMFGLLPALPGCGNLSYYAQSVNGHLNLVAAGQPIDRLVDDPKQNLELRNRLGLARDIRQFASDRLALPDNDSYRNYVDTGRDFVTWAVFAAPELSLDVRSWCFPVTGCVPYRGYFSKQAAERFAGDVRRQGFDVHVGGVPAYSTLGLSNDPLLNTMVRYGETYLAGVIFHELSHQRVYVKHDPAFNEAFATAVEQAGTEIWLKRRGATEQMRQYRASHRYNADFLDLIANARKTLTSIYANQRSNAEKRTEKKAAIARLKTNYRHMRDRRWNGYSGYDAWFDAPINNAKLATVSVYNDLVPDFLNLLDACSGDFERFYQAVEDIGRLNMTKRREVLKTARACLV